MLSDLRPEDFGPTFGTPLLDALAANAPAVRWHTRPSTARSPRASGPRIIGYLVEAFTAITGGAPHTVNIFAAGRPPTITHALQLWDEVFDWLARHAEHAPVWADADLAVLCGEDRRLKVWRYDSEFWMVWRGPARAASRSPSERRVRYGPGTSAPWRTKTGISPRGTSTVMVRLPLNLCDRSQ